MCRNLYKLYRFREAPKLSWRIGVPLSRQAAQPDLLVVELSASVVELGPDAVMITGDASFQRVQALQVSLIACS